MVHRRDIEGLRALAVVAVLLYHFGVPGFDGGFVGVDVFFVISGFLITSLLLDEREDSGHVSIRRFYARRARRLLPISATVIVATVIAGAVWLPATRLHDLAEEARAAALFAANLLFADRGTNYLTAGLDPSPLRHYWSLAVEEQFYVVWPALIGLVTLGARNIRRRTGWAMTVIVVASFALSALLSADQPSWSYFGLHTRAWELGVGALLACMLPFIEQVSERVLAPIGWAGMMGIAVSVIVYGDVAVFPGWAAALPVLATAAVLAAGDGTPESPSVVLGLAPLQYIGSRSYSLYLWHWPVIIIAEGHFLRALTTEEKLAAAALTIVLAEVGYRLIENPIRRSKPLAARPAWSLTFGAVLVATGVLAATVLADYDSTERTGVVAAAPDLTAPTTSQLTVTSVAETTAPTSTVAPTPPAPITMQGLPELPVIVDAAAQTIAPDNLRPGLTSANNDVATIYGDGCHQFGAQGVRTDCVFGDPNGSVTIALWGDSHAAQWFTPLEQMATAHGWRLLSLTQGSCTFLDVTVYDKKNDREFTNCGPWREAVRQYMREQSVDIVLLSAHWNLLSADTHKTISAREWNDHLPGLLDSLRADGMEPIVIGDSPNPDTTVPDCVAENTHRTDRCAAEQYGATERAIAEAIRPITAAAEVGFVEPGEWVCTDSGVCPPIIGDILVYRDGNHLSDTVAEWLEPLLDATLAPFVDAWMQWVAVSR